MRHLKTFNESSNIKYCGECGVKNDIKSSFCEECGEELEKMPTKGGKKQSSEIVILKKNKGGYSLESGNKTISGTTVRNESGTGSLDKYCDSKLSMTTELSPRSKKEIVTLRWDGESSNHINTHSIIGSCENPSKPPSFDNAIIITSILSTK